MDYLKRLLPLLQSRKAAYLGLILLALPLIGWVFYKSGWFISLVLLAVLILLFLSGWWLLQQHRKGKTQEALLRFRQDLKHRIQMLKKLKIPAVIQQQNKPCSLPHYLLIGSEGSGKTQFLQRSGIHFPELNSHDSYSLNDNKPGCDWYFSDHAVLIDVSGTCLNDSAKQGRWPVLLKQLKRLNRKYPLDGIMVMMNIESILQDDWQTQARWLRSKVDAIYHYFGYCLPVHLVFSFFDKIPGFKCFFSGMTTMELKQAFGFGFSQNDFTKQVLEEKQSKLCRRLQQQLLKQQPLQDDLHNRLEQLQFVEKFTSLQEQISKFLFDFNTENRFQEQVFLRSVHFTSSGNEQTQGYFSHDLLTHQLIKTEKYSALTSRHQQQRQWLIRGKRLAMGIAFSVFAFALLESFLYNWSLLKKGEALLRAERQSLKKNNAQKIAFLKAAAEHHHQLSVDSKADWYHRLGMNFSSYQQPVFEKILSSLLDKEIKQGVYRQLAKELLQEHQLWLKSTQQQRELLRGKYYSDLKTALMLQYPQYLQADFAISILISKWENYLSQHGQEKLSSAAMKSLLGFYLDQNIERFKKSRTEIYHFSPAILAEARHDLAGQSVLKNVYAGLAYQMKAEYPPLAFEQLLDDNPLQPLSIDSFYTRDFYQRILEPVFRDYVLLDPRHDWVLKRSFDSLAKAETGFERRPAVKDIQQQSLRTFQQLYFQDRLLAWTAFLEKVRFLQYHSLDDASLQLQTLEQQGGFYWQFLNRLHYEFAVSDILKNTSRQSLPAILSDQWLELEKLTVTQEENIFLTDYIKQLSIIRQELERLSLSNEPARQSKLYARKLLADTSKQVLLEQVLAQLDSKLLQIKYPAARKAFHSLLLQPVKESYRAILFSAMDSITLDWQQKIYQDFQNKLARRFPYYSKGEDAGMMDFIDFYQPSTGRIDSFLLQDLAVFLDRNGGHYQPRSWQGIALPFTKNFLRWLERQKKISELAFSGRQAVLDYKFAIYPRPSPGVKEILIATGGKNYPYRNGPQEWISFHWPGNENIEMDSLIRVISTHGERQFVQRYQGNWGIFHLLQAAKITRRFSGGYQLSWRVGPHTINLQLRSNSTVNLFDLLLFHSEPAPERLF